MPTVKEAIRKFLTKRMESHNGPDLIERVLANVDALEIQVNVSAGDGWAVEGKKSTFTDGLDEWWNVRIPKDAATNEPHFKDYKLTWPLDPHVDAIGCTGWDWVDKKSRWVGFDFDSITGHAKGVGVSDDELERVSLAAQALPYVEVRKSTGGNGLHLYVLFDDSVSTENHTVHAALGRAILGMMASETGFDFGSQIDACGGNMWIWGRKSTPENEGLKLLKPADKVLTIDDLPPNWRDHIEVVSRKRSKIKVEGVAEDQYDPFEALASSRRIVPLDDKHKKIIDELKASGYSCCWVPDHHLLQTHTCALQMLMTDHKAELGLIGFFKTISDGRDKGTPNCFLFPDDNGSFKVYRFSQGHPEAETWEQDGKGWTTCSFNARPNLKVAAKAMGGLKDPEKSVYVFDAAKDAIKAADVLGQKLNIPATLHDRETELKADKEGRLIVRIVKKEGDEGMKAAGWLAKKGFWVQEFETRVEQKNNELNIAEFDNVMRALISPAGDRAGWIVRQAGSGEWVRQPKDDAKSALLALGFTPPEAAVILGGATLKGWNLVNMPFQCEYPGNRQWNFKAAQFRYQPANLDDDTVPHHPHWDAILKHCGQDLNDALRNLDWARNANIRTGRDYLLTWVACMLREPYEKLPYLFFYGDQNSGKSIFHEAVALLMNGGVAAADRALTNPNDFNGELANAVLAYIEEKDIAKAPGAYNKLKDWVTSPMIWIRKMRTDAYAQINTLHFVQTANEREALTIKPGDTRITVFFVPDLEPGQEIPKPVLLQRLNDEAPHFMRTLMDLQLPPMTGRLRLPWVSTATKDRAEELSRNPLETFIGDCCHEVPGEVLLFSDFFQKFTNWLEEEKPPEFSTWMHKKKVISAMPHRIPYGSFSGNTRCLGNLSWEPAKSDQPEKKSLTLASNGRLKSKD